jgi:hypothetical protein
VILQNKKIPKSQLVHCEQNEFMWGSFIRVFNSFKITQTTYNRIQEEEEEKQLTQAS